MHLTTHGGVIVRLGVYEESSFDGCAHCWFLGGTFVFCYFSVLLYYLMVFGFFYDFLLLFFIAPSGQCLKARANLKYNYNEN